GSDTASELFCLRHEWAQLRLLQGFEELLCLPTLHGVETYWYQVEAVRKVLKQFHGRVLLADEVGLGKTIEAGMVLKEYALRGMVERVLVLVPASLVGQWHEELETKFGFACATTHAPLLRDDPDAFWQQKRIIASIATARRPANAERLRELIRDAMIRNTRALVALKLPRRHAATIKVDGRTAESAAYSDLAAAARRLAAEPAAGRHRLALHHLLAAAGSS